MKIAVYSSKGGVGKTPISTNIALDRGYAIGTNERFHTYESMEGINEDERWLAVPMEEEFPDFSQVGDDIDIVFDLAGSISAGSHSIASAIKQADVVIVPIEDQAQSLNSGINTLLEIVQFTKPVLVVATKLEKGKKEIFTDWSKSASFLNIAEKVHGLVSKEIPIVPLKKSKVFDSIFDRELSIAQLRVVDPLARYTYKDVSNQFDAIYSFIDSI